MRLRYLVAAVAVLAASCGGTSTTSAPTEAPVATDRADIGTSSTEAPDTTPAGSETGTPDSVAPTSDRPPTEGPAAPAFSTILSDGTSFSLADEANPVYMIFWAEW